MLRLTLRDKALLVKCSVCRWLTTTQIQRLYFPSATLNAVQKRLRKLSDAGYLRSYRENLIAEALHTVGPKGQAVFLEKGIEFVTGSDVPRQVEHLVGINDIRISVETGTVSIPFFFAHWQLSNLGWKHAVIPDAIFAVKDPLRRTFLVEYDRGTEPLGILLKKLGAYEELTGFPFEAVLIVTEQIRQRDLFSRKVRDGNLVVPVFMSHIDEIREVGIFRSDFSDVASQRRTTLTQLHEVRHEEDEA